MYFKFGIASAIAVLALATTVRTADASSCIGPQTLPTDQLNSFKSAPAAYLAGKSGSALTDAIASLAGSDSNLVPTIMAAFNAASDEDKASIAKGLGIAAKTCSSFPDDATRITEAVIGQSPAIKSAFNDGAGQPLAGAVGGGAGGGSSGASGGQTSTVFAQNTNSGPGENSGGTSPNPGFNTLFSSGAGLSNPSAQSISP